MQFVSLSNEDHLFVYVFVVFIGICSDLESIFYSLLSPVSFNIQGFDKIQAAKCE